MISISVTVTIMPKIPIPIAIPAMIMRHAAMLAFPIAVKVSAALVARTDPTSARVWGARPISVVPPIPAVDDVPIAVHPNVGRSGSRRVRSDDSRRGRGPDADAHRDLGEGREGRCQN